MVVITVEYHVIPGKLAEVLDALSEMMRRVEAEEPGCLSYDVLRSTDFENRLLLVEAYRDEKALADHGETPHFKSILQAKVLPLLAHRQRHRHELELSMRKPV